MDVAAVELNEEEGLLRVYREEPEIFTRTDTRLEPAKPKNREERLKGGWTGSLAAQRGYKAGMRIAKWAGKRRRQASLGMHFWLQWYFAALGGSVVVALVGLGILMAAGAEGCQLGVAAALFVLTPILTCCGALIVTGRNLDTRALGALTVVFLGIIPQIPILAGWGYCGFTMAGARCLGNAPNGALWTIALHCPAMAVGWGFVHRIWHGDKTGPRTSIAIATAMFIFVMLPLGVFLPIAAFDAWVSWDHFWKGDAVYASCMVAFTTLHAIFYRLMYASFLLEHYDPYEADTPPVEEQVRVVTDTKGKNSGAGNTMKDALVLVDLKAEARKRQVRTRRVYQLSFVVLFAANAVLTATLLAMLNTRHDMAQDIGKRNMLILASLFSLIVVPAGVFIVRGESMSLNARLSAAVWCGMILPQFAGFYHGTFEEGAQEALRAFLLRLMPAFTLLLCTYAALLSVVRREVLLAYGGTTNGWIVAFSLFFIFPALGVFVSRYMDGFNRAEKGAADACLLVAAMAPFVFLLFKSLKALWRAYRARATKHMMMSVLEGGAPSAAFCALITHVIYGFSMAAFSNVLWNYSHPKGGRGMCIALITNALLFFHGGPTFYAWSLEAKRSWTRSAVYCVVFFIIPLTAFTVYNIANFGDDARYAALFCGFLTPAGAAVWWFLTVIPSVLKALQMKNVTPARVFPGLLSFLCVFCVFPFGVFAPATVASSSFTTRSEKLASPIDHTSFAADNHSWATYLPTLLTMYGGFLVMAMVTAFSVALNAQMDRLQEELRIKARTIKVRRMLRSIQVKAAPPLATFVVREVEKLPREEAVLKLVNAEWVTWRKLKGNAMELVLADGAKIDLGEDGEEEEEAESLPTMVRYTPELRVLTLEQGTFAELKKENILPENVAEGVFQVLDAEEEAAMREARERELAKDGRSVDEVGTIAETVRVAQLTLTLRLGAAIPHLFAKRLKWKCLDELCAAVAEFVGVRRERVYVQRTTTHPAVEVTLILVEPPGARGAMALNAAVANPKRHFKTLDTFNATLARHVTLGGGADIVPLKSEINIEFIRVRRVKLMEGQTVGMHAAGEYAEEEADLDAPIVKKKKGGLMSTLMGFMGGEAEETLAEDEEREEEKRKQRWQRRKERKQATLSRFAAKEGRRNAITSAFINMNKKAEQSREDREALTLSAPAAVRRIVALSRFGGPKTKKEVDPIKNKAMWGGALQTLRDKEVLTFENKITFGAAERSSTMDQGDFFLHVVPKIFKMYSHEVEVDLEDSDDEDNIATPVPGGDDALCVMNMMDFRTLVGDLFPNGIALYRHLDAEWHKNRKANPDSKEYHASHAPSVRSVADMAFLDAVVKGGKNVKKLNYRMFTAAVPTIGAQAMPRAPFGKQQQEMRMRFLRVADKQNMLAGGLGGFFKHKVKVDLTKLLVPGKPSKKSTPVLARAADYESDDELPPAPDESTGDDEGAAAVLKKSKPALKSFLMLTAKPRFDAEDDNDEDAFFDEEFDSYSDDSGEDEDTSDGGETTDPGSTDFETDAAGGDDDDSEGGSESDDKSLGLGSPLDTPSRPSTSDWSRPSTAPHRALFEDDPDIAMLKEARENLSRVRAEEEARKKEEREGFRNQALQIQAKQEALRVEQIQEMIAERAARDRAKQTYEEGGAPPPPTAPAAPGGAPPPRPRRKRSVGRSAGTPTGLTSPDSSEGELSPGVDPPQPPMPPSAPSGPRPPARPRRGRKSKGGASGRVSFSAAVEETSVETAAEGRAVPQPLPPPPPPGPGPVTEQFDKHAAAGKDAEALAEEEKANKRAAREERQAAREALRAKRTAAKEAEELAAAMGEETAAQRNEKTKKKKKKKTTTTTTTKKKKKKKKKRDELAVRNEEWNWEHCVGQMIAAIDSVHDVTEIDEVEDGTFNYTSAANIIVMATIVSETVVHTLFAFSPKMLMYWGVSPAHPATDAGERALLAPPDPARMWHIAFFASFALAIFYFCIAVPAIKLAQSGKLGIGKDGKKARFGSFPWFYAQALNVLGGALYVMIMRSLFSVLICAEDTVRCGPCMEQFFACEDATLSALDPSKTSYNGSYASLVDPATGMVKGLSGWLDGYVYAPPGGAAGLVNASRLAGGCRELFNDCFDAHVVGKVCEEYSARSHVVMAADPIVPCWGLMHAGYLAAVVLAVATYYPISTFLFPNFQFADASLDIKYDAGFLVILNQAKLILAGVSSYYGKEIDGVETTPSIERFSAYASLIIQITVFAFLCYYNYTSQPCLVKWFNIFRTLSFAMSFVACCSSLVMVLLWDIIHAGAPVHPPDVTWPAKAVGLVILFGGQISVIATARAVHVRRLKKWAQEKAQKARMFKAAVQRTILKATTAGALKQAAGMGGLVFSADTEMTDEQVAEVGTKMDSVAQSTMALLSLGASSRSKLMNPSKIAKLEGAKEGVETVTKTFKNAVMRRQMAKIKAASALSSPFGKASSSATKDDTPALEADATAAGEGEESVGLLSLREKAALTASEKGKAPETDNAGATSSSPP